MNEYIIYTTEGYTIAPNENVEVENCQVLGCAFGHNADEAQDNLLKENPWISEAGFNPSEFFIKQLLTEEQLTDIKAVIEYLWADEERHYEESEDKENHIFNVLKRLKGL